MRQQRRMGEGVLSGRGQERPTLRDAFEQRLE